MRTTFLFRLARAGAAVVLVVVGGILAASLGHAVVVRTERSLDATSATATSVASAARGRSWAPVGSATASAGAASSPAASPAGDPGTSAASASTDPGGAAPSSASGGLSATRMAQLSSTVGSLASRYAAVAPRTEVTQFCMALVRGGAVQQNLRATVRAQLPAADQAVTDAQLDTLLDAASRSIC